MTTTIFLIAIPLLLGLSKKKRPSTSSNIPQGKGIFLETLSGLDIQLLKDLKIQWVCVLYYEKEKSTLDIKAKGFLNALSTNGIKVWLWAIPSAYDIDNFINLTKTLQESKWCEGFVYYLDDEFIQTQNATTVLFSKLAKEISKPIGILSDPEIELQNISPIFKFDAYQVHSGFNGEDNTNLSKKFPVFMEKVKSDRNYKTYAFWWDPQNLEEIKKS